MSDIMTFIRNEGSFDTDPDGYLLDLDEWSRDKAERIAAHEGVKLSEEHWQVIDLLREHFRVNGEVRTARELMTMLADAFAEQGGRRYLYKLFPGGPIHQSCRIAGLPVPSRSYDPSFGITL